MATITRTSINNMPNAVAGPGVSGVPSSSLEQTLAKRTKKRRRTRNILLIVGGVALILIIIAVASGGKEKAITVQTEKASTHTITEIVQATGKIQPEVQVKI